MIDLKIMMISKYCGGANPSSEVIESSEKPRLAKEITFYLTNSKNEKISTFVTDNNGMISLPLTYGQYHLFLEEKFNAEPYSTNVEGPCTTWKNEPNGSFELTEGQTSLQLEVTKTCNPCNRPNY